MASLFAFEVRPYGIASEPENVRLTGIVPRKKKAGGSGYHRSYFVHLEVLLISFLKKRTLPADWGINESRRFIEGVFCYHIAWNPTILSLPTIPGIPAYVPQSVPTVAGDAPLVRFAHLFSRDPDFMIELLDFVRKKRANPSLMDHVVLTLRQIPLIEYDYKGHFTDEELSELESMSRTHVLDWANEFSLFERAQKVPPTIKSDDELAFIVGEILDKKVTAATIREARRRMEREDTLMRERY